jgi:hypothetical protein
MIDEVIIILVVEGFMGIDDSTTTATSCSSGKINTFANVTGLIE